MHWNLDLNIADKTLNFNWQKGKSLSNYLIVLILSTSKILHL